MTHTIHYNLKKPETSDFYNIGDFNDNANIIDRELAELNGSSDDIDNQGISNVIIRFTKVGKVGFLWVKVLVLASYTDNVLEIDVPEDIIGLLATNYSARMRHVWEDSSGKKYIVEFNDTSKKLTITKEAGASNAMGVVCFMLPLA